MGRGLLELHDLAGVAAVHDGPARVHLTVLRARGRMRAFPAPPALVGADRVLTRSTRNRP